MYILETNDGIKKRIEVFYNHMKQSETVNQALREMELCGTVPEYESLIKFVEDTWQDVKRRDYFRTRDAACMYAYINDKLSHFCGDFIDPDKYELLMLYISFRALVFYKEDFDYDPYMSNITINDEWFGDYHLTHGKYEKFELSEYESYLYYYVKDLRIPRLCFFNERFTYPMLTKSVDGQEKVVMELTPYSINTIEDIAAKTLGDVLVLGLRMGYYSYLVSLKAKVKSVTIIENDQTLIDMFETLILPQFKKAQKIKIIKADAFDYISELEDGNYRHCFVDNMEDKNDVETYFKMKALCKRFKKTKFFYNFEPEFVYKMREQVFAEIVKEANKIFEGELSSLKLAEPWGNDMPYSKKYLEKVCREVKIEDPIAVISYCQPKYVLKFINKVRL